VSETLGLAALAELALPVRWLPGPLLGLAVSRVFASMTAETAKLDKHQRTRVFHALASYFVPATLFGWFWISGSEVQRMFMGFGTPSALAIYASMISIALFAGAAVLLLGLVPGIQSLRTEYGVLSKTLHQRQLDRISRLMGGKQ